MGLVKKRERGLLKKAWRKRLIPRRCAAGPLWQTVGQAVQGMQGVRGGCAYQKLRPPNRAKALPNPRARGESIEPGTAFSKRGKALPPRAHARKRVLPIRPSASCLRGISCVPEARPLQDVNRVSMIHLATLVPRGFQRGPQAPFGRAAAASESAAVFRFLFDAKKEHATHPALPGRDLLMKARRFAKSLKPPAAGR